MCGAYRRQRYRYRNNRNRVTGGASPVTAY